MAVRREEDLSRDSGKMLLCMFSMRPLCDSKYYLDLVLPFSPDSISLFRTSFIRTPTPLTYQALQDRPTQCLAQRRQLKESQWANNFVPLWIANPGSISFRYTLKHQTYIELVSLCLNSYILYCRVPGPCPP